MRCANALCSKIVFAGPSVQHAAWLRVCSTLRWCIFRQIQLMQFGRIVVAHIAQAINRMHQLSAVMIDQMAWFVYIDPSGASQFACCHPNEYTDRHRAASHAFFLRRRVINAGVWHTARLPSTIRFIRHITWRIQKPPRPLVHAFTQRNAPRSRFFSARKAVKDYAVL